MPVLNISIFPKLNRFDLSMIVISLVVGTGIFHPLLTLRFLKQFTTYAAWCILGRS
jgi:hypothetical protein